MEKFIIFFFIFSLLFRYFPSLSLLQCAIYFGITFKNRKKEKRNRKAIIPKLRNEIILLHTLTNKKRDATKFLNF